MYRRFVTIWLKDPCDESVTSALTLLRSLAHHIHGLLSIEAESAMPEGDTPCHVCLNLYFDSHESLAGYLKRKESMPTIRRMREISSRIDAVNYQSTQPAHSMPRLYTFIGPANRSKAVLGQLLDAGMTGIRLSLLHHTIEECLPIVDALREAAAERGVTPEVLVDDIPTANLTTPIERLGATGVILAIPAHIGTLRDIRTLIGPDVRLLCRVNSEEDIAALPGCMRIADELVIARAGMKRNLPRHEIPAAQRRIASIARAAARPFMLASDLLASMRGSMYPTVAELTDIHHAVQEGAASLMLTRETAEGRYPVEAMDTLRTAAEASLQH